MTAIARTTQQLLALEREPTYERRDFVVSPVNSDAFFALDAWPKWPGDKLALVGPEGSGKTHLARIWAQRASATIVSSEELDISSLPDGPIVLEDADRHPADEALFHLLNKVDAHSSLLLTGRTAPIGWPTRLPDLRSRLNALTVMSLAPPDDIVLEGVLLKLFEQRNIRPTNDVMSYLLHRIVRSTSAAREIVARIDERAGAERREVTRPLVREVLEESGQTLDLFE